MARIMLAIKNVLADVDEVSTLVFDEIDTGISGKASKAVAEKMKSIAELHQVICITHLPSIAARGDYNYYITEKIRSNDAKAVGPFIMASLEWERLFQKSSCGTACK